MELDLIANKQKFLTILKNEVHRDGIEKFIDWLETTDFFAAPYTGQYTLSCKGGLAEHSLNTYRTLLEIVEKYRERDPLFLVDVEGTPSEEDFNAAKAELMETLAICGLLHDICRADCWVEDARNVKNRDTGKWESVPYFKWDEKFIYGHGEKSVYILQQFMKLYIEEAQAIKYHSQGRDITLGNTVDSSYYTLYENSVLASVLGVAVNEADNILDRISWKAGKPE